MEHNFRAAMLYAPEPRSKLIPISAQRHNTEAIADQEQLAALRKQVATTGRASAASTQARGRQTVRQRV